MESFNLYGDEWDETRDRDGWRIKEAFVGHRIGGALIGASMSEVEAGSKLWPYHSHHANEEWVIVLRRSTRRIWPATRSCSPDRDPPSTTGKARTGSGTASD